MEQIRGSNSNNLDNYDDVDVTSPNQILKVLIQCLMKLMLYLRKMPKNL